MPKLTAIAAFLAMICFAPAKADPLPVNQQPMYGGVEKTNAMKRADAEFIARIESMGVTRAEGARKIIDNAWAYFFKGDVASAMSRFNQAWLLDPENGDAYHGFAVVMAQRGEPAAAAEKFFRIAISKPKVGPTAYVDYARFLSLEGRFDESLAQGQKALAISPTARNARAQISYAYMSKKDPVRACIWAKQAKDNGDALEPGYLEAVCQPPKK
jgi:tetratricopeptide (TPR) repeat protein